MKSILEHLFSGLLDSNNLGKSGIGKSGATKDILSDNEGFAADLNGFLINEKIGGTQGPGDKEIITNQEEIINIPNLKKKGMKKSQTVLVPKGEVNIEDKSTFENKTFTNKNIENKSYINHKNTDNLNTAISKNIHVANFDKKKNEVFSLADKYSESNENKFDKIKKNKKIKTFFTNYLNFSGSKNINKNKKFLKFILSNGLMSEVSKKTQEFKKINITSQNNNKDATNIGTLEKNTVLSNNKSIELNLNLDGSEDQKSNNLSTTSNNILKNILDIKSSNINQRMAEIFERNLKLGNNKFEIEIKPENLGKIEISMEINGDKVDINMKVDNNSVANIITDSNSSLQKSLASQGLNLTSLNLSYNNQNKFGDDSSKKDKKDHTKKDVKDEESVDLKIEKHHKNNNLVYIKA